MDGSHQNGKLMKTLTDKREKSGESGLRASYDVIPQADINHIIIIMITAYTFVRMHATATANEKINCN